MDSAVKAALLLLLLWKSGFGCNKKHSFTMFPGSQQAKWCSVCQIPFRCLLSRMQSWFKV